MDHQPDVQEQSQQHHHHPQQQQLHNSSNIVYIQQNLQDYQTRSQDPAFVNENDANLIGNNAFQQQNANFGQFENHYAYIGNGNFSQSNTPAALIPGLYNKNRNVSVSFRRTQFISGNEQDGSKFHPNDCVQFAGGNYGSADLQRITYQQPSHFFLAPNVGNQYPLSGDMLVPTCQSSGSSESSDDSSISNVSQQNYSSDSATFPNPHLEFTMPFPVGNQNSRNYNHFQQKDFPENYMSVIQQENQIPRCDSSKSETTESTCSSLSSGSTEGQPEESAVRLPVLVSPVININNNNNNSNNNTNIINNNNNNSSSSSSNSNNTTTNNNNSANNILNSYESNTHNSINTFSNQMHHNQINEAINQRNYSGMQNEKMNICSSGSNTKAENNSGNQNSLSDVNFNGSVANNSCSIDTSSSSSGGGGGVAGSSSAPGPGPGPGPGVQLNSKNDVNPNIIPDVNQKNNVVVVFPNRINNQNSKQAAVVNQSVTDSSKLLMQNTKTHQRVQQQKIFGLININNQASRDKIAVPVQMIKLNNGANMNSPIGSNGNGILDANTRYVNIKNSNGKSHSVVNSNTFNHVIYNVKSDNCAPSNNNNNNTNNNTNYVGDNGAVMQNVKNVESNEGNDSKNYENCSAGSEEDGRQANSSGTSHIQNTSESSVINSNYIQNKHSSNVLDHKENDCAMLIKETSDKCISQCSSDFNSPLLNSNVYLVKPNPSDIIKNNCCGDSSVNSCLTPGPNCATPTNTQPVPIGWRRLLMDGAIVYLSPSNAVLRSIEQVKMYLQTMGTCKCGLECPLNCHTVFNFNPKVVSQPWDPSDSELTRLCNHKRKAPALCSSNFGKEGVPDKSIKLDRKEVTQLKKKKKKHGNSYSGVSVSQLLAQRDRAVAAAKASRWPSGMQNLANNYQNVQPNQYQNVQVLRSQPLNAECNQQQYENKLQQIPSLCQDDKVGQYACVSSVANGARDANLNGQVISENAGANGGLIRATQMNFSVPGQVQKQDTNDDITGHAVNYNQGNQDFVQNPIMAPRPEGVVMTPQGLLFPPNMLMHRPRSIPPWHQTKFCLNKKQPSAQQPVLYERIPSLHQHMPPPTLLCEDFTAKKKHKTSSKARKISQESVQNQPSFMEDPNAYLAQQTALLHSTISRPNFNINSENQSNPAQSTHNSSDNCSSFSGSSGIPVPSNVLLPPSPKNNFNSRAASGQKVNQNEFPQLPSQQRTVNTRQSVETEAGNGANSSNQNMDIMNFNNHLCSNVSCSDSPSTSLFNNQNFETSQKAREKASLVQANAKKSVLNTFEQDIYCKYEWRHTDTNGNNQTRRERLPEQFSSIDENPVTSSTEKISRALHQRVVTDSRPIQGGTVSTSNGSPQPQPQESPSGFRPDESSPKCSELPSVPPQSPVSGNVLISSSTQSPFAVPASQVQRDLDNASYGMCKTDQLVSPSPGRSVDNFNQICEFSDDTLKFKMANAPVVNSTSSDLKMAENYEASDHVKNSVTSSLNTSKEMESNDKSSDAKSNRFVRTMASGHTVSSNTITSVLAGKAQTATVTVNNNNSAPPTISLVNFTNPNIINVPIPQKSGVKSPLEMVQSVVSSIQTVPTVPNNELQPNVVSVNKAVMPSSNIINNVLTSTSNVTPILTNASGTTPVMKAPSNAGLPAGHIIVSNNAQYIVASNNIPQTNIGGLKLNQTNAMPPISASPVVTNATAPVTQVLPAVGVAQQVLGQPTVLVNALPAPFVIQPGVMTVDTGLGHLAVATGNVLQSSLLENDALRTSNIRGLLSPDKSKSKKGSKKRKNQVASIVQVASPNNMIINQPFNQQNFAVSPGGSIQALTLVSNKHGGPAQIVMNNQNNFNQFNSQPQQINLLQPVNLASVPNFPAFQQFIVPGFGNMVMATDGTATILPDTNIGVQLQLQNVNGQNVLTPVQNTGFINGQGILTTPAGMLIRAPNQQKVIQSNSNPQFLSPNSGQFLVNQFQGQLSPLITTNLSPSQQIYTNSPPRQSPQEFIQIIPNSSAQNTTVVQQNTTIVQQQTTMVSNNQNLLNPNGKSNFILNNSSLEKPIELQIVANPQTQQQQQQQQQQPQQPQPQAQQQQATQQQQQQQPPQQQQQSQKGGPLDKADAGSQHSVSTQTSINKDVNSLIVATSNTFCQTIGSSWSGSPPDTTTHSPIGPELNRDRAQSSPDSAAATSDCLPQAMVQYVSSSINENETDNDAYLLSGFPSLLNRYEGLMQGDDKKKNVVESSTLMQESEMQVQVDRNCPPTRCKKIAADESVVSSHSDIGIQDKRVESHCIGFQEESTKHSEVAIPESRSEDFENEGKNDEKESLREGDLVWGSVRGTSAWPGKLVGPVTSDGRVLVRWFGGHISSPTRVNISQLQSLSQGLEAHHKASNKGRKNRKLSIELEAAIQEAMMELDKKSLQQKKITTGSGRSRRSHR